MEWNQDINLSRRKITTRLVIERALDRGWEVCGFKTNSAVIFLYPQGRDGESKKIFSASPFNMSYVSSKIVKDKYITSSLLAQANIPVPQEDFIDDAEHLLSDTVSMTQYLEKYHTLVVKPVNGSHGKGVTTDIKTLEGLQGAIREIQKLFSKNTQLIIQEQHSGIDVRVVCINNTYVDAISRIPASVQGDGRHTVRELIAITNEGHERGENYRAKLNEIPLEQVHRYLSSDQLDTILKKGEWRQVLGVSNVGMGGVRHNIKDSVPVFLRELAEKTSELLELPVCGVDFMIKRLPNSNDTEETLHPVVIEVNECPSLAMYDDLSSKEQKELLDVYLDSLV